MQAFALRLATWPVHLPAVQPSPSRVNHPAGRRANAAVGVKVADIIDDAARRQQDIETRVASLRQQIVDFEKEIETRKAEIARLESDHAETSTVKARLELAENGPPSQFQAAPAPTQRPMRAAPELGAPRRPMDG